VRIPRASVAALRRINLANMPDTCTIIDAGAPVELPGGIVRPGEPVERDAVPCRIVPLTAENDIIATREERAGRYIVTLPVGATLMVGTDARVRVTSAEFGWIKTLDVETVMDGYTDEVVVKLYCKER
jgi:hypothetical protein